MLVLKTSSFRPAHKNKVNFDTRAKSGCHTKTKSIYTPRTKLSEFRRGHRSLLNFDPYSKNNDVKSGSIPHSKNKSFLHIPRNETKFISIHTLN